MTKFLALTLYLLARRTLTLISSSAIIGCFQKVNYEKNLSYHLLFVESCRSFKKYAVLCGNNSVSVKRRNSLLFVANRYVKVTSK